MIIIREPSATACITDPQIRELVSLRFTQLCDGSSDPYDPEELGYLVLVEPGDTVAALEAECDLPILHNYLDPVIQYGHPDFVHSCEVLEDHGCCFEMTYVLGGDFGIGIFVPKTVGIDAQLLAMCAEYAEPVDLNQQ